MVFHRHDLGISATPGQNISSPLPAAWYPPKDGDLTRVFFGGANWCDAGDDHLWRMPPTVWIWALLKYGAHRWRFCGSQRWGWTGSQWLAMENPTLLGQSAISPLFWCQIPVPAVRRFSFFFGWREKNTGQPFTYWENHIKTRFPFITAKPIQWSYGR